MVDHGVDLQVLSWKEDKITIMQPAVMTYNECWLVTRGLVITDG